MRTVCWLSDSFSVVDVCGPDQVQEGTMREGGDSGVVRYISIL